MIEYLLRKRKRKKQPGSEETLSLEQKQTLAENLIRLLEKLSRDNKNYDYLNFKKVENVYTISHVNFDKDAPNINRMNIGGDILTKLTKLLVEMKSPQMVIEFIINLIKALNQKGVPFKIEISPQGVLNNIDGSISISFQEGYSEIVQEAIKNITVELYKKINNKKISTSL